MDRRDFIKYTTLATILGGTGVLSSCAGIGGKPPSNPEATEEDVMRHFFFNPVESTLESLGDRVTYFSNEKEFKEQFYQEHLPPEERKNVMAGWSFNSGQDGYSKREASLAWFIANEFPDLKVMWNLVGNIYNKDAYESAKSRYDLSALPSLWFGNKNKGEVDLSDGCYWSHSKGFAKDGLNLHGAPSNFSELADSIDYFREAIPKHLNLERQSWKESYKTVDLEESLNPITRRNFIQVPFSYLKA